MRRAFCFLIAAALLSAAAPSFDAARYLADIKYLASPAMKGRDTGSPELEQAAQYIAGQFRAAGVQPAMQPFEVTTSARLGRTNSFDYTLHGERRDLQSGKEFTPFNISHSGKLSGGVVFVGYGITESGYDDYAGMNVRGKIVLVLAHQPHEQEGQDLRLAYTKAANARTHGAKGVIFVRDAIHHPSDAPALVIFGRAAGPSDAGIPFVQVHEDVAKTWLDVDGIEKQIDATLKPHSFVIKGLEVRESVDVQRAVKTVNNVTAYIAGESPEYVIVGAHYDHVGLGEQFSMAPSLAGTVHPGADDNASGTAAVLELARYFAAAPKPKRGVLFITFAGEELGLLGSSYYANHPLMPLSNAVAMVNLDMIGRVRGGKVYIGGAGTGSTLRATEDAIAAHFPNLKPDYSEAGGYGSSDHTSFTAKQVPVLFFFSGLHADYHKPGDTWDKIDAPAAIEVVKMVAETVTHLDSDDSRPVFRHVQEAKAPSGNSGGGGSGYGPYFGSIPDFAEPPKGVRFADVREGSPAAIAGLKAGDILMRFGDKEILNLYDFTEALRSHKVGDEVPVEVLRGATKISARVKLAERK